jgi:hypothetical protein
MISSYATARQAPCLIDDKGSVRLPALKQMLVPVEDANAMSYLYRNPDNRITGFSGEGAYASDEQLELSDSEVKQFLKCANSELSSSDADTIRVIEDLVEVLLQKKLLLLTDLPVAVQQKLVQRRRIHNEVNILDNLMVVEEDIRWCGSIDIEMAGWSE